MSKFDILLGVKPDEVALLRFALDHAQNSISEAHPDERAMLQALIDRLEAAQESAARRKRRMETRP